MLKTARKIILSVALIAFVAGSALCAVGYLCGADVNRALSDMGIKIYTNRVPRYDYRDKYNGFDGMYDIEDFMSEFGIDDFYNDFYDDGYMGGHGNEDVI